MMSEWKKVRLGDLCGFQKGFPFKNSDYQSNGRKIARISNFTDYYLDLSSCICINEKEATLYQQWELRKEDVIIATVGSWPTNPNSVVGKVIKIQIEAEGILLNQNTVRIRGINIDQKFLFFLLKDRTFSDYIVGTAQGSASQASITQQDIKNYEFYLPPLEEQKAIADVLSALDDKIELNNRINKNLESQAQAIFKRWFVDFEFPDENGNPYKSSCGEMQDSELGEIPKGWSIEKLTSLCNVITKGTTPTTLKKAFTSFGINFIKAESISENHTFDRNKFNYIDDETNLLLKRSILKENDILVTIAGTIGRFAMVPKNLLPANTNQAIAILRINNAIFPVEYIYNFLLCGLQNEYFNSKTVQAVQANLSLSVIGEMPIIKPDMDCLSLYLDTIKPVLKLMFEHEEQNQKLAELRDYLLPKLMSGEIKIRCKE